LAFRIAKRALNCSSVALSGCSGATGFCTTTTSIPLCDEDAGDREGALGSGAGVACLGVDDDLCFDELDLLWVERGFRLLRLRCLALPIGGEMFLARMSGFTCSYEGVCLFRRSWKTFRRNGGRLPPALHGGGG